MLEVVSPKARATGIVGNYFAVLRRWFWLLGLCMLLGGAGAFIASKLIHPTYRATTLLVVGQQAPGSDVYTGVLASTQLIPTYMGLMTQPVVLQQAAAQVGGISARQLAANSSVKDQAGTQIIELDVDDASPIRAAQLANAIAGAFINMQQQGASDALAQEQKQVDQKLTQVSATIKALNAQIDALRANDPTSPHLQGLQQQLSVALAHQSALQTASNQLAIQSITATSSVSVFQSATPPLLPDHPKPLLNAAIGGALGLVIAAILVWLLEFFDRRIRTPDRAKALLSLPVLGTVGAYSRRALLPRAPTNRKLAMDINALVTKLELIHVADPARTIAVTSAVRGEGRTTIAVNLATMLARRGKRVLLIDGDLHQPPQRDSLATKQLPRAQRGNSHVAVQELIASSAGIPNLFGLSLILGKQAQNTFGIPPVSGVPGLYILPSGPNLPDSSELFRSGRIRNFLHWLLDDPAGGQFDAIVVDTPPADIYPDAALLARWVDATILVVDARHSNEESVLRTKDLLQRAHAQLAGIVLNRAHVRVPAREYGSGVAETQDSVHADESSDVHGHSKVYAYYNGSEDSLAVREGGNGHVRGLSTPEITPKVSTE